MLALVAAVLATGLAACAPGVSAAPSPSSAPATPVVRSSSPTPSHPTPSPAPTPTPSATPSPTPTPTPTAKPVLSPGDTGDKVRELQSRLKQIEWFSGKITDTYGDSTRAAVDGFQDKRELEVTGVVDELTWAALVDMTRTPTDDEMHNRLTPGPALYEKGSQGEEVREVQARLKQIGWFSGEVTDFYGDATAAAVKGFQEKRELPVTGEVDQRTLTSLEGMTREPTKAELTNEKPKKKKEKEKEDGGSDAEAAGWDDRCLTGRALCISKQTSQMAWIIDGEVQSTFDVRFGSEKTPTREGSFVVGWKSRDHVSTIYDTPMPYAMFFDGGQAVHYSADFAARGYNGASHGCVNVRDKAGIKALFEQVDVYDKVIVYS
ncbi:peptidoglycan-binding protein [Desertihabitans brevis]|uniref:Peptidoglycan-binding protein n=1 Tax=Desertihabitans brevis TaxID=2268447 RepID=A0A367YQH0_9ACTN|nr:peptidoglycan-binding protein [Desertihabitans brevis]